MINRPVIEFRKFVSLSLSSSQDRFINFSAELNGLRRYPASFAGLALQDTSVKL
jgi:hypothetical protein